MLCGRYIEDTIDRDHATFKPIPHVNPFIEDFADDETTYASDGIKITIDGSSSWHGQPMMRTELVQEKNANAAGKCFMSPNLKAETNKGTLFYHFSMKKTGTNSPKYDAEHQINFLYEARNRLVELC